MQSVQASGLKRSANPGPVQVIAVTGGKGGVGKTSVAVNLATALGRPGKRVLLLDGDLGLANVDVFLGLSPRHTMAQRAGGRVLARREHRRVAQQGFGSSRPRRVSRNSPSIDPRGAPAPGAGLQRSERTPRRADRRHRPRHRPGVVLQFSQAAQHVLVVVCDEPASMTDAYALIKVLSRDHGVQQIPRAGEHVPVRRGRGHACSTNSSGCNRAS